MSNNLTSHRLERIFCFKTKATLLVNLTFFLMLVSMYSYGQAIIGVTANDNSISNGQTTISSGDNTDFGSQSICDGSKDNEFVVHNYGNYTLIIGSITSSDPNFVVSSTLGSIAVGDSALITISFDPTSSGIIGSVITINNNDPNNISFVFNIGGTGITTTTDITRGSCLELDGLDDYVDCSTSLNSNIDGQTSFSVEAWVRLDNVIQEQAIVSNSLVGLSSGFELKVVNSMVLFIYRDDNGSLFSSPSLSISAGEWHHVAATLSPTTISVFLDGIEATNGVVATGIKPSVDPLVLGANNSAGACNVEGEIEEVRLWNLTRTPAEIRENMHLSLEACVNGLIAYYQFNSATGLTVYNKLGNGSDGSIRNGAVWASSEINLGNDSYANSSSQSINNIPAGMSLQDFSSANLSMNFIRHSVMEDFTVTYQEFTPNTSSGSSGFINFDNYIWTINKSTLTGEVVVDYLFTFPANTFVNTLSNKYALYHRPANGIGEWRKVSTAHSVSSNSVGFGNIGLVGQFMIVQESANAISDVRGNMYNFDGIDDYINIGSGASLVIYEDFSVECWFKSTVISNTEKVLVAKELESNGEGFVLSVTNNNVNFCFPGMASFSGGGVVGNQWHHVVATYGDAEVKLYLDGVLIANGFLEYGANFSEDMYIGAKHLSNGGGARNHFLGAIDEVKIWAVDRSQSEIRESMHLTLKGTENDLVSYFQFNTDLAVGTLNGVEDAMALNNGRTLGMSSANYLASEVAVGGGKSDRISIPALGPVLVNFNSADVSINFGATTPNGEIVVYRIETEKPHGWNSISGDVDNEYFIVENFGANQSFSNLLDITFNRIGYISEDDVNLPQASSPLVIYKRGDNDYGATWGNSKGGAESSTAGSLGSATYDVDNNLTSFSQIVIVNNSHNSLLPIELLSFEAERMNADLVEINWSISSDKESAEIHLEVLCDGNQGFVAIYKLGSKEAEGTSSYQFYHSNSFPKVSYYRLKIINSDETYSYSDIKAVDGLRSSGIHVDLSFYPIPVQDKLKIRFDELPKEVKSASIQITNLSGQLINEYNRAINSYQVIEIGNLLELMPATYVILVKLNNGQQILRKFIKG